MNGFNKVHFTVVMSSLALLGGVAYLFGILLAWTEHNAHREMWTLFVFGSLFGITLVLPLMGAGALARERDNGTWEMLETSLIEPRHLITGKVSAPLFFVAALFLLLLPMLLPCVRNVTLDLTTLFVLAAASFCYSAWGVWLSWHFRSPVTAMSVALVSMLVILLFVPWLLTFFFASNRDATLLMEAFLEAWHPWAALALMANDSTSSKWTDGLLTSAILTTVGLVLLMDLNRRISKAWRLPRRKLLTFLHHSNQPVKEAA